MQHEREAEIDLDKELDDLVDVEKIYQESAIEFEKEALAKLTHNDIKVGFSEAMDLDHIIGMLPKQLLFARQRM